MSGRKCHLTLRRIDEITTGGPCIKSECMAWVPEVTIDMTPIKANPEFADMALKLVQNLAPLGVETNGNNITVRAHCVLLEPRK